MTMRVVRPGPEREVPRGVVESLIYVVIPLHWPPVTLSTWPWM